MSGRPGRLTCPDWTTSGGIDAVSKLVADEHKAQRLFAKLHWPNGVQCPYCGAEKPYRTKGANPDKPQWKCAECRRKFSCTTGIRRNVHDTTFISSDNYPAYKGLDKEFAGNGTVDHDKEYVRGVVHTNFAENYFSLLKRGIMGTFHVVGRQHIDRYLNEFSFRWNNRELDDGALVIRVVRGNEGMRLTYRPTRTPRASLMR